MIQTIELGGVNAYLLAEKTGYILIDTGVPEKRAVIQAALENAGCTPGNLRLIVITHGDYDHAGNAAYLRDKYGAKIAMHREDAGRVERADWSWNMKPKPDKFGLLFRIVSRLIKPGPFDVFTPDISLEDGQRLSDYGADLTILHIPGHTRGSLGVLTPEHELVCGDLMANMRRPSLHFFIDDMAAAQASLVKLRRLGIDTVYPGHGKPYKLEQVTGIE
jgi:hydroxyacylglutathione hydrolase